MIQHSSRPPSVGSFAGGPEDIDEQLHRLNKDYNQLMDRYRRLKQLKKTPERDLEMDGLLKVRGRAAQEESCISVHTEERPEKVLEFFFFLIKKKNGNIYQKKKITANFDLSCNVTPFAPEVLPDVCLFKKFSTSSVYPLFLMNICKCKVWLEISYMYLKT